MTPFQQALGNAKVGILSLSTCLFFSVILNAYFGYKLANAPTEIKSVITGIPAQGESLSIPFGTIPEASVYSMAENVWMSLNNWSKDGYTDAVINIKDALKNKYMTQNFANQYGQILNEYNKQGFTKNYRLITQPLHGGYFNPKDIRKDGNSWLVKIDMSSLFYYNPNHVEDTTSIYTPEEKFKAVTTPLKTKPVKEVTAEYIFRVVPYPNKVGIAVDGLVAAPKIIEQHTNLGV